MNVVKGKMVNEKQVLKREMKKWDDLSDEALIFFEELL